MRPDTRAGRLERVVFASAAMAMAAGLLVASGQEPPAGGKGSTRVAASSTERFELRQMDARLDRMVRAGDMRRRLTRQDTVLADGRVHERFDQYVRGVRVVGGDLVRQERGGVTESIFGTVHDSIAISTDPGIPEDRALELFAALSGRDLPPARRPELVVLPADDGRYVLAWRMHVWTGGRLMHTFLDAHTGAVALQYNDLQTQAAIGTGLGVLGDMKKISTLGSGGAFLADDQMRPPRIITYDMKGNLTRTMWLLEGWIDPTVNDIASDNDNNWSDGVSVDAHVHLGWTYDFLFQRFGRKGLDDRDMPVRALIHPVRLNDLLTAPDWAADFYLNAFWCGECGDGFMMFGEGLPPGYFVGGKPVKPFAAGLDIVAHELAHGLTDYSSSLDYLNESGALNEAFSDIIGTSVEFFYQQAGQGTRAADYLIGEDVIAAMRSMADPRAFGDPDHYSARYRGTDDNGGVHWNSGIANHAYYLAIEGGTNRTSGLTVEGVGAANREQIEKVFYRAFVYLLTSRADFFQARLATIQSARELYGAGSPAERAITQAWTAVGVY